MTTGSIFTLEPCKRHITRAHERSYPNVQFLIANEWVDAASGKTIQVRNPATDQIIGTAVLASIANLDHALAAVQQGFLVWRDGPSNERAATMRRAAIAKPAQLAAGSSLVLPILINS